MKTAIVVDSGSNIYNETIEKDGLFSVPLQLTYEGNSYKESIEITNEQVNTLMQDGVLIQTSLPSLGEISDLFEQIKKDGYDQIFAVPITSGLSSTLGAMKTAAQLVDIPFDYIDCFTTMHIQLLVALRAHDLFKQGKTNDEVKKNLNEMIDRETVIDINLIDFVKFISTCYGYVYQDEAKRIVEAMESDQIKQFSLRFRCSHTLFLYGTPEYQNICLISAMIYLGIPIDGYFDGANVLV